MIPFLLTWWLSVVLRPLSNPRDDELDLVIAKEFTSGRHAHGPIEEHTDQRALLGLARHNHVFILHDVVVGVQPKPPGRR